METRAILTTCHGSRFASRDEKRDIRSGKNGQVVARVVSNRDKLLPAEFIRSGRKLMEDKNSIIFPRKV